MARVRSATPEEVELWHSVMNGTTQIHRQTLPTSPTPRAPRPQPMSLSRTVDLHGLTLEQAHRRTIEQLDAWKGLTRNLVFVTGKSGRIREEFSRWLEGYPGVSRVETLDGGGAFRVHYPKPRVNKR